MKRLISIFLCLTIIFSITYIAPDLAHAAGESIIITVDNASQYGVNQVRSQITNAVNDMVGRLDEELTVYVNGNVFNYILNNPQYQSGEGSSQYPDKYK